MTYRVVRLPGETLEEAIRATIPKELRAGARMNVVVIDE